MPLKLKRKTLLAAIATPLFIAGCAAIAPSWITDTNDILASDTLLYSNQDETGFYKFTYSVHPSLSTTYPAQLSFVDLEGNISPIMTVPFYSNGYRNTYHKQELSGNDAFFTGSIIEELIYVNPDEGITWTGESLDAVGVDQTLRAYKYYTNEDDDLIFNGRLETVIDGNFEKRSIIGMVSTDGSLQLFDDFPDALYLSIKPALNSNNFIISGRYSKEYTEQSGKKSFIQIRSKDLTLISENSYNDLLHVIRAKSDTFFGYNNTLGVPKNYGVYDYEGNLLETKERPALITEYPGKLVGESVYYDIETVQLNIEVDLFDFSVTFGNEGVKVCQYDFDFNENWCRVTKKGTYAPIVNAQVINGNELAVSYETKDAFVSGVQIGVISEELTFLADMELNGTRRYQTQHEIFSMSGNSKFKAEEEAYSYTGRASFVFFDFVVEPEIVSPGVIRPYESLFFSGKRVVSSSAYKKEEGSNEEPRLTYWEAK